MKALIFISAWIFILFTNCQHKQPEQQVHHRHRTLTTPIGNDTAISVKVSCTSYSFAVVFYTAELDGIDTLSLYAAIHPDSTYTLLYIDQNLDGVNDNPFTLSTSDLIIWGQINGIYSLLDATKEDDVYLIYYLKKGTSTPGLYLIIDDWELTKRS